MAITMKNENINVIIYYDPNKIIDSEFKNGKIQPLKKPIKGGYWVEARPNVEGQYIDYIGLYSVCFELTQMKALKAANNYIKNTL